MSNPTITQLTPKQPLRAWLVDFHNGTVDEDDDGRYLRRTIETVRRVVTAESEEALAEHLSDAYEPESDDGPTTVCELPEDVAANLACYARLEAAFANPETTATQLRDIWEARNG